MHRRDLLKYSIALGALSAFPLLQRAAFAAERAALPIPALLEPDAASRIRLTATAGSSMFNGKSTATWGYNGALLGPALRLTQGKAVTVDFQNRLPQATTVHWHGLEVSGEVDGGPQGIIAPGAARSVTFTPVQRAATCWFHPHQHGKTGAQVAMGIAGLVLIEDNDSRKLRLPQQWGIDDIPLVIQDRKFTADGAIDYQLDIMSAAVGWFGDTLLANGAIYPQHAAPRGWLRLRLLNGCNARSLNIATSDNRPLYVIGSDGGLLGEPVKVSELTMLTGERFEVLVNVADNKPFDIVTRPVTQIGMNLPPFDKPVPVMTVQPIAMFGSGTLPDTLVAMPPLPKMDNIRQRSLLLAMDPRLDMAGMQALEQRYGKAATVGMAMHHGAMAHGDGTMQMADSGHAMSGEMAMPQNAGGHDAAMQGHNGHGAAMQQGAGSHADHGGAMAGMSHGQPGGALDFMNANTINGKAFDMKSVMFEVPRGQYERWVISGEGDMMLHPFHIHGTQFRILSENGKPPAAHRAGWKDTVSVENARSEVLVRFDHTASAERPYMAHCHLLEHEDTGMMMGFSVS